MDGRVRATASGEALAAQGEAAEATGASVSGLGAQGRQGVPKHGLLPPCWPQGPFPRPPRSARGPVLRPCCDPWAQRKEPTAGAPQASLGSGALAPSSEQTGELQGLRKAPSGLKAGEGPWSGEGRGMCSSVSPQVMSVLLATHHTWGTPWPPGSLGPGKGHRVLVEPECLFDCLAV